MAWLRPKTMGIWLLLPLGGVLTASLLMAEEVKVFSHKDHLSYGADCDTCHNKDVAKGPPPLNKEACKGCHEEVPVSYRLPAKAKTFGFSFPHKAHAEALACLDCHRPTAEDKGEAGKVIQTYGECQACHQKMVGQDIPTTQCERCHGRKERQVPPADHKLRWLKRHGEESQWRVFVDHGRDCKLCHEQGVCVNCHYNNRPQSHTGLWRVRTHGVVASWEREKCKTCHETGTCVRCHRNEAPLNHRGAWIATHGLVAGSVPNERCGVCHATAFCLACHGGFRSR